MTSPELQEFRSGGVPLRRSPQVSSCSRRERDRFHIRACLPACLPCAPLPSRIVAAPTAQCFVLPLPIMPPRVLWYPPPPHLQPSLLFVDLRMLLASAWVSRKKDMCGVLTASRLAPALPTSGGGCRDTQQGRRRGTSLSFLRAVDIARCVLHSCRFPPWGGGSSTRRLRRMNANRPCVCVCVL